MDATQTDLEIYIQREHNRATGTILNALDSEDISFHAAALVMRQLHYEGWRRRYQITADHRDDALMLPGGCLIRERTGTLRESFYFTRQDKNGDDITEVWFRKIGSDHPGTPARTLDFPITILDTP
jgi:hypothetical protein